MMNGLPSHVAWPHFVSGIARLWNHVQAFETNETGEDLGHVRVWVADRERMLRTCSRLPDARPIGGRTVSRQAQQQGSCPPWGPNGHIKFGSAGPSWVGHGVSPLSHGISQHRGGRANVCAESSDLHSPTRSDEKCAGMVMFRVHEVRELMHEVMCTAQPYPRCPERVQGEERKTPVPCIARRMAWQRV